MGPGSTEAIGIIGVGKMGEPIARKLLAQGASLLIPPRSHDAAERLRAHGAEVVADAEEVIARSDVLLLLLPNPTAAAGIGRLVMTMCRKGQLVIEHGTVGVELVRQMAEAVHGRGAALLDAPVSGGPDGAAAGTLTAMAGGDEDIVDRADRVLSTYCSKIRRCGPTGSGQTVKLVNQLLVALHTAASAEAAAFASALGADPEAMLDVVSSSFGASRMMERNLPRITQRAFDGATPVSVILKDLGLITDAGRDAGCWMPMAEMATGFFGRGVEVGIGDEDMAGLVRLWER